MRSTPEWHGKNDDEQIPPRVKVRIFSKYNGRCANCGVPIRGGNGPVYDHKIAIVNNGPNRESNIQPLCKNCDSEKYPKDVAEKSSIYKKRLRHLGIKRRKGKPMMGSKDSPFKKKMDGTVVRR